MHATPPQAVARLKIKTYVVLFLLVFFSSAGNAILDKGMKDLGAVDLSNWTALSRGMAGVLGSGTIWLGIGCMLVFMICDMLVLSWADYSFVIPFVALSYAVVPLLGHLWLGEPVSLLRWAGIGLIFFGVFLVSRTPPRTTETRPTAALPDRP